MVSAWWLLVALWLGGCIGFVLATLLTMSKDSSRGEGNIEHNIEHKGRLAHHRH